jgi:dolichyl-diphosphooligosaccharide--protein glycosyltransferase
MSDTSEVGRLLAERPDLEPAVEAALAADERHGTWTFDDLETDSGSFGELVSRGVVEKADGAYRLADPAATRAALDGETATDGGGAAASLSDVDVDLSLPAVDGRVALALTGALALVVAFRLTTWNSIFRGDDVVLTGNDPYHYRYWVEQVAAAGGTLDVSGLSTLPGSVTGGEPLLVAVLWFFTGLLGGGQAASGTVLAWYPIVAAVLVGLLTYLFARELTDDRRIAIAAVAMLAVLPVHVQRSGLGFADHHAFDYVWLMLTATAVVMLARLPAAREALFEPDRKTVLGIFGVGFGVGGQVLAWEAGPLLLLPLLVYFPVVTLLAARDEQSSLWANAPLLVGLAIASVLAGVVHLAFGWHNTVVAFTPALLFVGGAAVTLAAEAVHRADLDVEELPVVIVLQTAGVVGFVTLITLVVPSFGETLFARIDVLVDSRPIVEFQPLFSLRTNGWLILLGPPLFVAMAGFVWASVRAWSGQRHWLAAALYGWSFLFLASLQQRFAGELSPFVAVFAGFGLVYLAWKVDVARVPAPLADSPPSGPSIGRPTLGQVGAVVVLFALIGGFSAFQSPVHAAKAPIFDGEYETAQFAEEYAAEHELEYPENYVMSTWSRNRMYNYFVSGEAGSYTYARENYLPFFESTDPVADGWYEQFEGRVGFVVVDPTYNAQYPSTLARLKQAYGSRANGVAGLGHYRLVYEADHDLGTYQLFSVVPGATMTGTAAANDSFVVATEVTVDDTTFTYRRLVETDANGQYSVTLAYPGEYEMEGTSATVTVSETAVEEGGNVTVSG